MNRAEIFVDSSFLVAVADPDSDDNAVARAAFTDLVERSRAATTVLVTHALAIGAASERLTASRRADLVAVLGVLVAPIEIEPAHADALRLARRTLDAQPGLDIVQALTLALMARRRITAIATFDPLFSGYDVDVIPVADPRSERG